MGEVLREKEMSNVICIGDVHGEWEELMDQIRKAEIEGANLLQVGDFGLGFREWSEELLVLYKLDAFLERTQNQLLVIRGNHDDPSRWKPWTPSSRSQFERILLVPDYTVLTLDGGYKILCIGGGISIDRFGRRERVNYWASEKFLLDRLTLNTLDLTDLYAVATHISPAGTFPYVFDDVLNFYLKVDPSLEAEVLKERRDMRELHDLIMERVKPKYWLYGHYHKSHVEVIGSTAFKALAITEMWTLPSSKYEV
jgi:predicted phosphodiesterase